MQEREEMGFKEELKVKLLGAAGIGGTIGGLTIMATAENNTTELVVGAAATIAGLILMKLTDHLIERSLPTATQ